MTKRLVQYLYKFCQLMISIPVSLCPKNQQKRKMDSEKPQLFDPLERLLK